MTLHEHRSPLGLVDYGAPLVLGLIIGWRLLPAVKGYKAARKAGLGRMLSVFVAMCAAAGMPTT